MSTNFSAKHYQAVADTVSRYQTRRRESYVGYENDPAIDLGEAVIADLMFSFAEVFSDDNPRFKRDRFISACQPND